jgi:D-3-phosphoglycerate dehydrogenase
MKILANDGISNEGKAALENAGFTVITDKVDQDQLAATVNEQHIEIVLVRSATTVRKEVIDACPGLKLIGRGGVGMDNIDVAYAREKGLTVINTPASSSQSVAELVMGMLFTGARSLHHSFKNMENGDFSALKKRYAKGIELRGKTLLVIGFGRIGQSVASYAIGSYN